MYAAQATTADHEERRQSVWDMQAKIYEERPWIVVNCVPIIRAYRSDRLTGFRQESGDLLWKWSILHARPVQQRRRINCLVGRHESWSADQYPYTQALRPVRPIPNPHRKGRWIVLEGEAPSPVDLPPGCRFHTRCPVTQEQCALTAPSLSTVTSEHKAACLRV